MSEIFSFRLSKSNPREARAIEILEAKTSEGICTRQIITEGLLLLSTRQSEADFSGGESIRSVLNLILDLVRHGNVKVLTGGDDGKSEVNELSEQFKTSLKREVKMGLKG